MKQGFYVLAFPQGRPWRMTLDHDEFMLQPGNIYLLANTVPCGAGSLSLPRP